MKRVQAVFFRAPSGHEPVREWLLEMPKAERLVIGTDIKTAEYAWPVGMPVCRPLGKGLYEIRSNLKNTIARVIFTISGHHMVLLHGFIKKTQQTPEKELNLALARMKQMEKHR